MTVKVPSAAGSGSRLVYTLTGCIPWGMVYTVTGDKRVLDPAARAAYLELPGKPGHDPVCECAYCQQHRHTWDLAVKRGVWTRERVLAYAAQQAADDEGERGEPVGVDGGGAEGGGDAERVHSQGDPPAGGAGGSAPGYDLT